MALDYSRGRLRWGRHRKVGSLHHSVLVCFSSRFFRLQKEIEAFELYIRLSPAEKLASEAVAAEVESILQELLPRHSLSVVGSHRTDLATPTSDIDFSLFLPSPEKNASAPGSRSQSLRIAQKDLRKIHRGLHNSLSFREAELVFARVPLVKAVHYRTWLQVQISTMSPDRYDTIFTAAYLAEFPTLRPLFILLRHALEMRNLNTPFEGGLGSYSLLMMIVAALKQVSGQYARTDLANHLLHVLDFYASADLYLFGFCVDPPRTFKKAGSGLFPMNHRKPYMLCLQDPADATNDLGRNAYAIKHVQRLFGQARLQLMRDMVSWEQKTIEQRKAMKGGLLNLLVRANYRIFEFGRKRVQESMNSEGCISAVPPTELKAPDLSRRVSLRGLRKKGWVDEVNAERKRRGREVRQGTAKRRARVAEKRNAETKT